MKIGFFDSGIGGLTVLYESLRMLPDEDYIYYADTLNVPYGSKPKKQVKQYVFDAVEFIEKQGVKAIVIACNTATSVAIEELREKYSIPIIGMEPAVKPAIDNKMDTEKRVLVTATALTLKEEKMQNLINRVDSDHIVDLLPLPGLVEFAERFEFKEEVVMPYLREQFGKYNLENYEAVVLGCTHFPLFKDMIKKLVPANTDIIDGNKGTVRNLKRILESKNALHEGSGKVDFYKSGCLVEEKKVLDQYNQLFKRLDAFKC